MNLPRILYILQVKSVLITPQKPTYSRFFGITDSSVAKIIDLILFSGIFTEVFQYIDKRDRSVNHRRGCG